jgi:hypothetical protein
MPSWSTPLTPLRHSLASHLGRLGRSFDTLAGQVREAMARSVGRTVAEAVAEAVQAALADSPAGAGLPPRPPSYRGRPRPLEDQAADPAWRDAPDYPRPGLLPPRPDPCGTCTACPPPGRRGGGRGRRALPEEGADIARPKSCVGWVASARRVVRGGHRSPEECV